LGKALEALKVKVEYDTRITGIEKGDGHFILVSEDSQRLKTRKVVIATGGASYKATGSTGDGFLMAGRLGHKVAALKPALVPLKAKEPWVKDLQGLGLENVRITFHPGGKRIGSDVGEVMFTHFGVSGPLVLDMSGAIVSALERYKEVLMTIDLKPGLRKEQLESKLLHKFSVKGSVQLKNLMQDILPRRMIAVFLSALKLNGDKRASQIKKEERTAIIDALKSFPLTITGSLPVEEAMVTAGGVSLKEVDPRTMESKRVPGLYFAGEALDLAAPSGGYNLQAAFSTGYLAGEKAAK
jgi:predicted Rossmann fold flavoprotein